MSLCALGAFPIRSVLLQSIGFKFKISAIHKNGHRAGVDGARAALDFASTWTPLELGFVNCFTSPSQNTAPESADLFVLRIFLRSSVIRGANRFVLSNYSDFICHQIGNHYYW